MLLERPGEVVTREELHGRLGTLTHLWIGNHIAFSTFDPATGKQTQIHSIDDPEWFLMNWTLSSDGHTLALAKKHRTPLAAAYWRICRAANSALCSWTIGSASPVWILLGWAIPSPNGRDVAIWMSAASSNAYLLEDF